MALRGCEFLDNLEARPEFNMRLFITTKERAEVSADFLVNMREEGRVFL